MGTNVRDSVSSLVGRFAVLRRMIGRSRGILGGRFGAGTDPTRSPNTTTSVVPSVGWKAAYAVLGAMIVTIPLGIGFFVYEGVFAVLSDLGALIVGLALAPLVWSLYRLHAGDPLNEPVFGLGVVTVAGICLGSFGLVGMYLLSLNPAVYGATFLGIQFLGWILLGFWLLGIGLLGRRTGAVESRIAWTAVIAGVATAGGMVTLVYSYAVGSFTILFPPFMLVFVVGFLLWAFWLGGDLRAKTHDETTNADGRPR